MELENRKVETPNNLKDLILERIQEFDLGSSHGKEHLERVLGFALQLQDKYGGDVDIITAASLLHDLGRSNPELHGQDSRDLSVELALGVLEEVKFPPQKIPKVITCILEHDQPENTPSSRESEILKDADFLSGLGVEGIFRIALWTGESREGIESLIDRLSEKMRKRIASLTFPESRLYAQREYLLVRMVLDDYNRGKERSLPEIDENRFHIVIDGMSGAGKSTLIENLSRYFEELGKGVIKIKEPGETYSKVRSILGPESDPYSNILCFLLDRMRIKTDLRGNPEESIILSDRSFVSSAVYQQLKGIPPEEGISPEEISFLNRVALQPSIIIILVTSPEEALKRIMRRHEELGIPLGKNETLEGLRSAREKFLSMSDILPTLQFIDTTDKTEEEVFREALNVLRKNMLIDFNQ